MISRPNKIYIFNGKILQLTCTGGKILANNISEILIAFSECCIEKVMKIVHLFFEKKNYYYYYELFYSKIDRTIKH